MAKLPDSVISNPFIVKRRLSECIDRTTAMEFRRFEHMNNLAADRMADWYAVVKGWSTRDREVLAIGNSYITIPMAGTIALKSANPKFYHRSANG